MSNALNLVVGFALKGSKEKRSIALDPIAMEVLGVKEGDPVLVTKGELWGFTLGHGVELKVIKGLPEDVGKEIIRLTEDVGEFEYGDPILIRPI